MINFDAFISHYYLYDERVYRLSISQVCNQNIIAKCVHMGSHITRINEFIQRSRILQTYIRGDQAQLLPC